MRLSVFDNARDGILSLGYRFRRIRPRHILPDAVLVVTCILLAQFFRGGADEFSSRVASILPLIPMVLVVRLMTFAWLGVYDILWRYVSFRECILLVKAVFLSTAFLITVTYFWDPSYFSRGTYLISTTLLAFSMVGVRVARRYLYEYPSTKRVREEGRRTLIYGAGSVGRTLAHRFSTDHELGHQPIGFVDDDPEKIGRVAQGLNIFAGGKELGTIIETKRITELVVAVRNPTGDLLLRIMQTCTPFGIRPRLAKISGSTAAARSNVDVLRSIELDDLLTRPQRKMEVGGLKHLVAGKRVLVTGAGGSIGSELARQIIRLEPEKLLILDHSEHHLHIIHNELKGTTGKSTIVPLLVDIKNRKLVEQAFFEHTPDLVFHAAAYKHVDLVQGNPCAGIMNNVLGTRNLLELSEEHQVESFILISTDKAVNPGGIMGATKRVCEFMISEVGKRTGRRFASVRFGNVLGSSGSLIPILTEQILQGRPVTITHPDMKRYFMLIPEAVSLVLKAATLSRPGDIMVLKMGAAVKVVDVARSLILMLGKTEEQIPIIYTGIRPGEKLEEELYLTGAEEKTLHPDILVVPRGDRLSTDSDLEEVRLRSVIDRIVWDAQNGHPDAVSQMMRLVKEGPAAFEEVTPIPSPSDHNEMHLRPLV